MYIWTNHSNLSVEKLGSETGRDGYLNFTVRQALKMDIMQTAKLLAGNKGIDNEIEWVNINEIIDEFAFFKRGELFVTTGFNLKDKEQTFYDKFIDSLYNCNVAAIAIQTGYYIKTMPKQLINLCNKYQLPLIELPKSLSFSGFLKDILQEVMNLQVRELEHAKKVNEEMVQHVLEGKGLNEVTNQLSSSLNSSVLIFDDKYSMIAFSGVAEGSSSLEAIRNEFRNNLELAPNPNNNWECLKHRESTVSHRTIIEKIVVTGETYGYIVVVKLNDGYFNDLERITISAAKTVVALIILNERSLLASEERLRGDLLEDIINRRCSEDILSRRFKYLGYPSSNYTAYIISADTTSGVFFQINEFKDPMITDKLLGIIRHYLKLSQCKYIIKNKAEKILVLLHVKNDMEKEKIKNTFLLIQKSITSELSVSISIGFGCNYNKLTDVKKSFWEAEKALKVGRYVWKKDYIIGYEELGIYRLFVEKTDPEEIKRHYAYTVGGIITYDEKFNGDLFNTLETYYDCDKNITKTANQLFIHRHTLRYRLNKIKEITGLDPNKSKDGLILAVGILIFYLGLPAQAQKPEI